MAHSRLWAFSPTFAERRVQLRKSRSRSQFSCGRRTGRGAALIHCSLIAAAVHSDQLIQQQVHAIDAQQALRNVTTMDDLIAVSVAQPRLNMVLLASFAAIALLLACVGIYGVVSYAVAQRRQEIGVRMALGATRAQIAIFFMRRILASAILGLAGGTVAALMLTRLLRSQLYQVAPNNPEIYFVSILLLLLPVFAATLRPSLLAANLNPVDALRVE